MHINNGRYKSPKRLHALESKLIQPQTMVSVRTGIAIEIPIDSERYEEIIILVLNFHQTETIRIQEGERIAQIIITKTSRRTYHRKRFSFLGRIIFCEALRKC